MSELWLQNCALSASI